MDRETDVGGIGAHFDRKRSFRDDVSRRRSDAAASDDTLMFLFEHDFCDALIAPGDSDPPLAARPMLSWNGSLAKRDPASASRRKTA
jgi:hypothetical protein